MAWSPRSRDARIAAALASLEAEREAAEAAEAAKAEAFRERQRAGQRTGRSPASAAVALAEENLARVTGRAGRPSWRSWQERYAAGQPRRGRAARPAAAGVDDHCRVRQAAARLEAARARAAAAERRPRSGRRTARAPARCGTSPTRTRG